MDILAREKAMLEVKQSSTLVLLPNSIAIRPYPTDGEKFLNPHPLATHKVTLDIQYAATTFSVLVTMEQPLDFVITTPHLLPMKYLDNKSFPPEYPDTSLTELVKWLTEQLKEHMKESIQAEEKLSGLLDAIENLVSMGIISEDSYEIAIVGDRVTFLVKFRPEKDIKLASLSEMVKEDKLLNGGGHFFVFKIVYRVDTGAFLPGEFSIAFGSDLSDMLPELANYSEPGLTAKLASDLVSFLMHMKDTVNGTIAIAVERWKSRARLLLQLLSIFEDGELAVPYLDSSTMSCIDLAFRTKLRRAMLKIELSVGYPEEVPKVTFFSVVVPTEVARETRGSGEIKDQVVDLVKFNYNQNMKVGDIVDIVVQIINNIATLDK